MVPVTVTESKVIISVIRAGIEVNLLVGIGNRRLRGRYFLIGL
jgi:hypothetical protein